MASSPMRTDPLAATSVGPGCTRSRPGGEVPALTFLTLVSPLLLRRGGPTVPPQSRLDQRKLCLTFSREAVFPRPAGPSPGHLAKHAAQHRHGHWPEPSWLRESVGATQSVARDRARLGIPNRLRGGIQILVYLVTFLYSHGEGAPGGQSILSNATFTSSPTARAILYRFSTVRPASPR